jgi:hypothetical protein
MRAPFYTVLLTSSLTALLPALAQSWRRLNPLPVEAISGYVTYQGQFDFAGPTRDFTLERALLYTRGQLTRHSQLLIASSSRHQVGIQGTGSCENSRYTLSYQVQIIPQSDAYFYTFSHLALQPHTSDFRVASGTSSSKPVPPVSAEEMMRRPSSYTKKGQPSRAFRDYCQNLAQLVDSARVHLRTDLMN